MFLVKPWSSHLSPFEFPPSAALIANLMINLMINLAKTIEDEKSTHDKNISTCSKDDFDLLS